MGGTTMSKKLESISWRDKYAAFQRGLFLLQQVRDASAALQRSYLTMVIIDSFKGNARMECYASKHSFTNDTGYHEYTVTLSPAGALDNYQHKMIFNWCTFSGNQYVQTTNHGTALTLCLVCSSS